MRRSPASVLLAVVLAACGGGPAVAPTPSPPPVSASPNPSVVSSSPTEGPSTDASEPAIPADVDVPADAPLSFAKPLDARDLPLAALAPPGAEVGTSWRGEILSASGNATTQAVAFAWGRRRGLRTQSGLEVWERWDTTAAAPWRTAFAFTDPPGTDVLGVRFDAGDLTHDRSPDLLTFEDLGGSGACGVWRVIQMRAGSYEEVYRRQTCDTDVRIVGGDLDVRESVYAPGDAHCCPSAFRTTILRWDGQGWDVVRRTTTPA